jgi:fumarate reductase flavoprotein subunit
MPAISRRSFVAGAAVAAGAAAVAAAPMAASATVAPETVASFAIEPVALADAGEPAYSCEYLVIGGGNCGMMSAAHASDLGLDTILLEKSPAVGGSCTGTEVTQGYNDCKILQEFADDPDVVNMSQETGTYEEIYTYFMMHNAWGSNAELVSNYVQNNHGAHDLLYQHGARPMMLLPSLDAPTNGIMYEGQGQGAFNVMRQAAEENGVTILTDTAATRLVVDDGRVVGAMASVDGGDEVYVEAKAVFVGTGGFGANAEMVEAFIPGWGPIAYKVDEVLCHDGDGIRMMLGAGAAASDLVFAQPAASSVAGVAWDTAVDKAAREPYLWVGHNGKRLGNEKWTVMDTTYKVGIKEPGHTYFNVVDADGIARMETEGFVTNARTVLGSNDPIAETGAEVDAAVEAGLVFRGETLEELAEAAGIDAAGLAATVARYNEMCAAGEDTQFFKDASALYPIENGPFYAFELVPSWYSTLCGVKINGQIQAVDADNQPIAGLYAGGLDSGEFFKEDYAHGFSGSCSGYSYFTGWYGALMAQDYIASL